MKQEIFQKVYRGRQSWLHHASYLRMSKVLVILDFIRRWKIPIQGARVLDYGFGAGTLFRYLPASTKISGVEQDPILCQEVGRQLSARGFQDVRLEAIDPDETRPHPLLDGSYDLVICSHVLEHLENPARLLRQFRGALSFSGRILGVIPIHERRPNPHHLRKAGRPEVEQWAKQAGLILEVYEEADPWLYWFQPLYAEDHGWRHRLAQAVSLTLGIPATLLGPSRWMELGKAFRRMTASLPTQATFSLRLS